MKGLARPLPIVASATFAPVAREPAQSLREDVRGVVANAPRRVNRLIELALIGAHRCVGQRPLAPETAIYMACTHGTVADAATMVRDAVRGAPSMPVTFINTSSNMAGFYVASTLGLHSGNHVGSAVDFAWEATLELACASGGPALIGAVEECAWPLADHRIRMALAPGSPLLETSAWWLADPRANAPLAWLDELRHFPDAQALLEWLRAARPAPATALQVSGSPPATLLPEIHAAAGIAPRVRATAGYSGMPAALLCAEFIEGEAGSLLQLSCGRNGAWYAVALRRP